MRTWSTYSVLREIRSEKLSSLKTRNLILSFRSLMEPNSESSRKVLNKKFVDLSGVIKDLISLSVMTWKTMKSFLIKIAEISLNVGSWVLFFPFDPTPALFVWWERFSTWIAYLKDSCRKRSLLACESIISWSGNLLKIPPR